MFPTLTELTRSLAEHQIPSVVGVLLKSNDDNARSSYKMSTGGLVAVLEAVQELCRSSHGVRASLRESSGCVWHHQHRCAGDDVLELPLGWMSGAIVSDYDLISKIRARWSTRNHELYTGQWTDTHSSRVREQQVFPHFPLASPAHPTVIP